MKLTHTSTTRIRAHSKHQVLSMHREMMWHPLSIHQRRFMLALCRATPPVVRRASRVAGILPVRRRAFELELRAWDALTGGRPAHDA